VLCNILTGGASLLVLWIKKDLFSQVRSQKFGRERYWLILTIAINNIFFLALMFSYFNAEIINGDIARIRTLLGLVFIYLVTTSLFRVYPQSLFKDGAGAAALSASEQALADKIIGLLAYEKIYHESGYSRSDLAKELGVSEYQASSVINAHFGKSLPQLLNEYRVEDAKHMLAETDADIKIIAEETGFNSIATFNRVFRDITGETPSAYRKNSVKK
jgi:AraC-like DNA-binding protein